jgi:hypothetical protein
LTDLLERHKDFGKIQLMRGDLGTWWIRDKSAGQGLPDDQARDYINMIIDSGFRVEVYAIGIVQNKSHVQPFGLTAEVTQIIPKKKDKEIAAAAHLI